MDVLVLLDERISTLGHTVQLRPSQETAGGAVSCPGRKISMCLGYMREAHVQALLSTI